MRFTSFAALCSAPLALAGTMNVGMSPRDVDMALQARHDNSNDKHSSGDYSSGNSDSSGNSNSNSQAPVVEEIIIIWQNQGGGAATSTLNTMSTVAAAAAAAATHQVCPNPAALSSKS